MVFQSLEFFALLVLSVSAESLTGNILAPQNLSITWLNDFETKLSWEPPQDLPPNCTLKYKVTSIIRKESSETIRTTTKHERCFYTVMDGGFLGLSVQTICGDKSGVVVRNFTYPDLVRNVQCYIRSSSKYECLWQTATDVPDLGFFFRDPSKSSDNCVGPLLLQECPSYHTEDGKRTGCIVHSNEIPYKIHMVFNGTLNNTLVRNTFERENLKGGLPALNWTITEDGDKFNIHVIPPDFKQNSPWNFQINYTECDKEKPLLTKSETTFRMDRVPHCQYCIQIKEQKLTPWNEPKCFGAMKDPNVMVYAFILIPLMFAALAVLTFICCRKNKETIFPKVPEPRDLLSDISDNNNKSNVRNLYIPAEEEEDCKITLVLDPQLSKLDS